MLLRILPSAECRGRDVPPGQGMPVAWEAFGRR